MSLTEFAEFLQEAKTPEPGRYEGVPDSIYHAWKATSRSDLNLILRSPSHYKLAKRNPVVATPAMHFGTAVHLAVLQPEQFEKRFYLDAPPAHINRRTNAGKEEYAEWAEQHEGKEALPAPAWESIPKIVEALRNEPAAHMLLTSGASEVSYAWHDETLDGLCRARPDVESDHNGLLVDLKTCLDARPEAFSKACYNYSYHRQAAWYLRGACAVSGEGAFTRFCFVCVERAAPYGIGVYVMDERDVERGEREMHSAMTRLKWCRETGEWPGYGKKILPIGLPAWGRRQIDEGMPT